MAYILKEAADINAAHQMQLINDYELCAFANLVPNKKVELKTLGQDDFHFEWRKKFLLNTIFR